MKTSIAKTKELVSSSIELSNFSLSTQKILKQIKEYFNKILLKWNNNEIINFLNKHSDILKDSLFKEEIISEIQKNLDNPNKLNFIYSEILAEILTKIDVYANYEKIVDKNWNVVFYEWLLRVKSKYNFNHFDLLDFAKISWKTFSIFNIMFSNIINDLKESKINWPISINTEVSDITDPDFIPEIERIIKYNNIDLKKQTIIIEILENQQIPDTKEFFKKILLLKKMWFVIAFDDIFSEKVWLKETIENLKILNYNIDIIKVDWKKIHDLYNMYKISPNSKKIKKCSKTIQLAQKKWIKVVAEWIETKDMLFFAQEILWIDLFQGFLFKK